MERLEAAGHRVHCCFTPAEQGEHHEPGRAPLHDRYLCHGVTDGTCPLEQGIDVALLVRGRVTTEPTAREAGASCALRAGVPLVESGPEMLDPFAPWLTARAGDDIVTACEEIAELGFHPLRDEIALRISRVLVAAGIDPNQVDVLFDFVPPHLTVRLRGPSVDGGVAQALSVRVLDSLRTARRSFGHVGVTYESRELNQRGPTAANRSRSRHPDRCATNHVPHGRAVWRRRDGGRARAHPRAAYSAWTSRRRPAWSSERP